MKKQFTLRFAFFLVTCLALFFSLALRPKDSKFVYSSPADALAEFGERPIVILPPDWETTAKMSKDVRYCIGTCYEVPVDDDGTGSMNVIAYDRSGRRHAYEVDENCYAVDILGSDGTKIQAAFLKKRFHPN